MFTTYAVTNATIFNNLSVVDMMGRSVQERAQRFINAANGAAGTEEVGNVTRAASAYMGITLT